MKVHGLLLQRHAGGEERRHEGRIAVDARNTRWCSDGLEIGCDNGERVRVAFALDCCDREAMSFVGDCQESCVRGHSDADGGRLWRSRKTPWTSFWTAVTRKRFSTRTGFSTS